MDKLEDNSILKFNPDTLEAVRKVYHLDKPGEMKEAIDILEAWIQKQAHFTKKDFSRGYLERVIIQLKGSVERAKSQLDKICTLRTLLPNFFEIYCPEEDLKELKGYVHQTLMPKLTEDNGRIYFWKLVGGQHSSKKLFLSYQYCQVTVEYIKSQDYCDGLTVICDMRGVPIAEYVSHINLTTMQQHMTIAMEGYDLRIKNLLFLSTSKTISLLINILKQFMSAKIASRIHVFKNVEELYNFVPKDFLPEEYGGKEKSLEILNEEFLAALSTPEMMKHWQEMRNARTDESKRIKCTFDESLLGLSGTFRTLNVD